MKKQSLTILFLVLTISIFISSCSGSRNSTNTDTGIDRNDLKGDWTLASINYEGAYAIEKLKITLLGEGDKSCLEGSTWSFPNNGKGSYTISNAATGCVQGTRNIVWSYREENNIPIFQYKVMEGGVQAHAISEGYRFRVINAGETSMQLQSEVAFEGKSLYINYTFNKM